MSEVFLKKFWEEEGTIFLVHFINNRAVRQMEVTGKEVKRLSSQQPVVGNSKLADQPLSEWNLTADDFISRSDFERYWDANAS
jgi:hypothetical protein